MEYLTEQQIHQLIDRLLTLTTHEKLEWNLDDDFSFWAHAGDFLIILSCKDRDDRHPYTIEVSRLDNPGYLIAKFASDFDPEDSDTSPNSRLEQLYIIVKRRGLNLENVVDDLFNALEDLE